MNLLNCKNCGKIIRSNGEEFCEECKYELDIEFNDIKEYLDDHPGASINEISKVLAIPIHRLKMYLRDERLEIVRGGNEGSFFLTCKKCDSPIKTGSYCDDCSRGLVTELKTSTRDVKNKIEEEASKKKDIASFKYINKDKK